MKKSLIFISSILFIIACIPICKGQSNSQRQKFYYNSLCPNSGQENQLLKNNRFFDDCLLDYIPQLKYTTVPNSDALIRKYFQFEDLVNNILEEDYKGGHRNFLKIRRINAIEISSSALPRFFSIKNSLYISLKIKKDGTVKEVYFRDYKISENHLKKSKELYNELKKSVWHPGLYNDRPVNASLNYLVIF